MKRSRAKSDSSAAGGRCVRLINPRFVKAFVKGSKNDAADAEAIYEAATRPTMRFVPVKSVEQQDPQSVHRARERVINTRTALINHIRAALAAEVLHLRIGCDPAAPYYGTAPLKRASLTAGMLHAVELALAEIFENAPLGSQIADIIFRRNRAA